jgi:hypothetical protein
MYALAKQSPYGLDTARELPEFHPFGGVSPPDHTANQDGLGVVVVKPYCLISSSFPNLLVYLPRAQAVKKTRGMVTGRGKVKYPWKFSPEQSIKLPALVFLVLHDEGVLLTEIRFAKICCR